MNIIKNLKESLKLARKHPPKICHSVKDLKKKKQPRCDEAAVI